MALRLFRWWFYLTVKEEAQLQSMDFLLKFLDSDSQPLVTNSLEMKRFVRDYPSLTSNEKLRFNQPFNYSYNSQLGLSETSLDSFDRVVTNPNFLSELL